MYSKDMTRGVYKRTFTEEPVLDTSDKIIILKYLYKWVVRV